MPMVRSVGLLLLFVCLNLSTVVYGALNSPKPLSLYKVFRNGIPLRFAEPNAELINLGQHWIMTAKGMRPFNHARETLFRLHVYDLGRHSWTFPEANDSAWALAAFQDNHWVGAAFLKPHRGESFKGSFSEGVGFRRLWSNLSTFNERIVRVRKPVVGGPKYEVHLIEVPAISLSAFWLHSEAKDYYLVHRANNVALFDHQGMELYMQQAQREFVARLRFTHAKLEHLLSLAPEAVVEIEVMLDQISNRHSNNSEALPAPVYAWWLHWLHQNFASKQVSRLIESIPYLSHLYGPELDQLIELGIEITGGRHMSPDWGCFKLRGPLASILRFLEENPKTVLVDPNFHQKKPTYGAFPPLGREPEIVLPAMNEREPLDQSHRNFILTVNNKAGPLTLTDLKVMLSPWSVRIKESVGLTILDRARHQYLAFIEGTPEDISQIRQLEGVRVMEEPEIRPGRSCHPFTD